eukprot:2638031-Heterocapsa_arctica.AAC.1
MTGIVRWIRKKDLTDPIFASAITDDTILEKEEMEHSMVEKHANTQCLEALTEGYSLAAKDMNA